MIKKSTRRKTPPAVLETPAFGEVAVTESALYRGMGFHSYNPDKLVRQKGGLQIYDEMRLDEQVKACLMLKKHAVLASGWRIVPASQDVIDVELAEFVEYVFAKMAGSLTDCLFAILTALDYGYSISEIVWDVYSNGAYDGRVGIKAIKSKRPHFYNFDLDAYGNITPDGLIHSGAWSGYAETRLPINKFIVYTNQCEFSNHYGVSDLRPAYRSWWGKDNIIRFWNIYLERFGSPLTIGKYKTGDKQKIEELKSVLKNIQSKTSITLPDGFFDISFLEPQRRSSADFEAALTYYDRGIARSILIPDQLNQAGDSGGGAYAKAKVHFDVFLWVIFKLREEIENNVIQEQLIRRLIEINYGTDIDLPQFKFNPLTDDQRIQLAQVFADAVQKGAVHTTLGDERHIREILQFPKLEETQLPVPPNAQPLVQAVTPQLSTPLVQADISQPSTPQKPPDSAGKKKKIDIGASSERIMTAYEKRIDFKTIDKTQKEIENKYLVKLKISLEKQRDTLTAFVNAKLVNDKLSPALVNSGIDLKYKGELKAIMRELMTAGYEQGHKDARAELPKNFGSAQHGIAVVPQDAVDYLQAKADFTVSGISDKLTGDIKEVLLKCIREGRTTKKVIADLQSLYEPYLNDGSIIVDGEQATAYRLETLIRTNASEAYNYGRRAIGEDPDLAGYVIGYQFSEILDDRTTELSMFVDGKIISVDSPYLDSLTYPLHYNDRGMFIFVTRDDLPVEFITDADAEEAIIQKNI